MSVVLKIADRKIGITMTFGEDWKIVTSKGSRTVGKICTTKGPGTCDYLAGECLFGRVVL